MIRNIIAGALLLAILVSIASLANIASAVEPELNLDISAYSDNLLPLESSLEHPFSWTPDITHQQKIINLYERFILTNPTVASGLSSSADDHNVSEQRLFSFEIYQGDGLDDMRQQSKHYNRLTLPDEDTEAYGVSVKQRF